MPHWLEIFALLLIGHALCDYSLQGDWLSKAKNHKLQLVPNETIWWHAMACHTGIHAGAVYFITGSWILAGWEFIAHYIIDYAKCEGVFNYNQDQCLHIICKVIYIFFILTIPAEFLQG